MKKENQLQLASICLGLALGIGVTSILYREEVLSTSTNTTLIFMPFLIIGLFWTLYASGKLGKGKTDNTIE